MKVVGKMTLGYLTLNKEYVLHVLLTSHPIGTYADIKPEGERFISAYVPSTDVM